MRGRGTNPPAWNPSITQKVKQALYDSGHEDLVTGILESGLKEIEKVVAEQDKRIVMLEAANQNRVTNTGVLRAIKDAQTKGKASVLSWLLQNALVPVATAGIGFLIAELRK